MSQQSFLSQTATGADINFTIDTFSSDEIKVYVDGELKSAGVHYNINPYNSNSQSTVDWIGTAPSSPSIVRIIRETDVLNQGNTAVEGRATYSAGSSVKADDLNNNQKQVLRALQERQDQKVQRYDIEDGEVIRSKIAADAVDGTKIADDSISIEHMSANSVDSDQYVDGSIDLIHMSANSVDSDQYVDGSIDRIHLEPDIIDSTKLADDSVDSEHLVADSIDTEHYAPGSVDADALAANSVTEHKIANTNVTEGKLAPNSVVTSKINNGAVNNDKLANLAVTEGKIADNAVTNAKIAEGTLDGRYYTETELDAGQLDNRYYTETEAEARFLRQDSSETIASGVTWSASDAFVATTAAIDLRIIELVDNVGGFVPIANETSFPTENPDINTANNKKGGTIVSVNAASANLPNGTSSLNGTTLTITNGRGSGLPVIITGVTATIPQGFGFLVETTATDHTYAFHRLVPKASEVSTVAANAVNIAAAGANVVDINNFADLYQISTSAPTDRADSSSLQIGDLWFDSSSNKVLMIYDGSAGDGFTAATPNASDLVNINIVAGHLVYQEDLGLITNAINTGSGNNSVNTVATNIDDVNTVANSTNLANITAVAADASDIGAVAGKATEIGRLGTADAVADMAILGTTDVVADLNTLATSAIVSDLDTLADIAPNITTVAGISSDVTAVAADQADIGAVAGKVAEIGRLGTADAVADLAILGTTDVVADMNTLATADIVADMNMLATSDVVADMALLATTDVIADMALLAVSDVITDMSLLATTDCIADMAILGSADVVADMNMLAVSDVISDMNTLAVSSVITNIGTVAASIGDVNRYANEYVIQSGTPSSPSAGDLWYNTTSNVLNYYSGSTFVGISPGIAGVINDANPALANHLDCNDKNLTEVGTVSGDNLQIDFGTI